MHWPYCLAKCPYCDFNSHVASNVDQGVWAERYLSEIRRIGQETEGRVVNSVYFGGGTPSLMDGETVTAILNEIRATWPLANDCEITLEANPGAVELGRFAAYRDAGVDRISIGVQALNDLDLQRLGRLHDVTSALAAIRLARSLFGRVSFDLIYARQNQSLQDWQDELQQALDLEPDHLSLYQLTIEEGTVFARRHAAGHLKGLPEEDLSADMFDLTQERCEKAGLPAYEVSNHAREGQESRHNLIYWNAGDYAGIGPGAHGRLTLNGTRWATEAPRAPNTWLKAVEDLRSDQRTALSREDQAIEYVMMGLRTRKGLSMSRLNALGAGTFSPNRLSELQESGLLLVEDDRLRATDQGRILLNRVIAQLLGA
nr:radical SAM family heme chaperone HemW [Szabonella alba]